MNLGHFGSINFGDLDVGEWLRGGASAFISGGAGAVTAGFVVGANDPTHYNPSTWKFYELVFSVFLTSGLLSAMNFWRTKPLPEVKHREETLAVTKPTAKGGTVTMTTKDTNNNCPCGACVTCSCSAAPNMDEDGLCAGCGGQPYVIAALSGEPHVGVTEAVDGALPKDEQTDIARIIAEGEATEEAALVRLARSLCDVCRPSTVSSADPSAVAAIVERLAPIQPDCAVLSELTALCAGFGVLHAQMAWMAVAERICTLAGELLVGRFRAGAPTEPSDGGPIASDRRL